MKSLSAFQGKEHERDLQTVFAAELIGRGQNVLPAGRTCGRTPSCLLLESGKPAIGFFL